MNLNLNNKKIKILTDFKSKLKMFNLEKNQLSSLKKQFKNIDFEFINLQKLKRIYDCQVYWGTRINDEVLSRCYNLKWIHFGSVGVDKINLSKIDKKIIISNSKRINTLAVFNLVMFFLLDTTKKILINKRLKNRIDYEKMFLESKDLSQQKICILGYGNIAKKIKQYLVFNKTDINFFTSRNLKIKNTINIKDLIRNLNQYDTIINLLQYNENNKNFLNQKLFKKMKRNVNLILVGRISTVNILDLFIFLKLNKKATCYIDALPNKDNKFFLEKLRILKNVFITPHIGGYYRNYWPDQISLFKHNLKLFLKGKKIKNQIMQK